MSNKKGNKQNRVFLGKEENNRGFCEKKKTEKES